MKLCAFDVETAGTLPEYALQPFRVRTGDAWLTSFAVASWARDPTTLQHIHGGLARALNLTPETRGKTAPTVDMLRRMLVAMARDGYTVVCWNAAFDVAWLIALGLREEVYACRWLDAMLLKRHLLCRTQYDPVHVAYGLKETIAEVWPGEEVYAEGVDFQDMSPEMVAKRLGYNKLDASYTLRLAEKYLAELTPEQKRAALIEASCIPQIAETMVEGLVIDPDAAAALDTKLAETISLSYVKLKLEDPNGVTPEVLASPKQLAELLYDQWQLRCPKRTEGGQRSTDKEALAWLATTDPRAQHVRDYREAHGNRSKFVQGALTSLQYNGDGASRPNARIFGTYTGRLTYSSKQGKGKAEVPIGIAIHQMKRDKDFRRMITVPEGYTLIEDDFAGQEYKWMAVESGDERMLQLCQPGEDPHSFMGARCSHDYSYERLVVDVAGGVEIAKRLRQLGKVGNLSCQYRTSANTLEKVALIQHKLPLAPGEAQSIHANYRTTYPGVKGYWKRQIEFARYHGYVETQAGRRIQLGTVDTWDPENHWSYESTAINFPIQGVGADQKYLALCILKDYLPSVDGRIYFELHDGLFTVVPDRYAERAAHEMRQLLSNLPYKRAWGKTFPIQFPVDAKMGKSWGELKEVK